MYPKFFSCQIASSILGCFLTKCQAISMPSSNEWVLFGKEGRQLVFTNAWSFAVWRELAFSCKRADSGGLWFCAFLAPLRGAWRAKSD